MLLARAPAVIGVHDAERDAVDLLENVRQERVEPLIGQVERAQVVRLERRHLVVEGGVDEPAGPLRHVKDGLLLREAAEVVRLEEEQQPPREGRLQGLVIEVDVQERQVGRRLERVRGQPLLERGADAVE